MICWIAGLGGGGAIKIASLINSHTVFVEWTRGERKGYSFLSSVLELKTPSCSSDKSNKKKEFSHSHSCFCLGWWWQQDFDSWFWFINENENKETSTFPLWQWWILKEIPKLKSR